METDSLIGSNRKNRNKSRDVEKCECFIHREELFKCGLLFIVFIVTLTLYTAGYFTYVLVKEDTDYESKRVQAYASYDSSKVMKFKEGNRLKFLGVGVFKIVIPSIIGNNTRYLHFYNTRKSPSQSFDEDDFGTGYMEFHKEPPFKEYGSDNKDNQNNFRLWFKHKFTDKGIKFTEGFIDPNDDNNYKVCVYDDSGFGSTSCMKGYVDGFEFSLVITWLVVVPTLLVSYFILFLYLKRYCNSLKMSFSDVSYL